MFFVDGKNNTKANFNILLNGTALPVRLTQFSGIAKNSFNELIWSLQITSTEKSIVLQSSVDGFLFYDIYEQPIINGTTDLHGKYNDFTTDAKKHYRLKIADQNGSISFSNILLLQRESNSFSVSPNPAKDFINISLQVKNRSVYQFELYNAAGKLVKRQLETLETGMQSIQLNGLNKLAAGVYTLKVGNEKTTERMKLMIK